MMPTVYSVSHAPVSKYLKVEGKSVIQGAWPYEIFLICSTIYFMKVLRSVISFENVPGISRRFCY